MSAGRGAELTKDWYDREMRLGRRAIVQWHNPNRPDDPVVAGMEYDSDEDAARNDYHLISRPGRIHRFESWDEAERWLRAPSEGE